MALAISISISALDTEAELTIFEAVIFGTALDAATNAAQFLDHEGCASLQFAHFAFPLSLPLK